MQKLSYESAPQKTLVPYGKQGQNIMGYASSDLSNYHNTNLQRLKENESRVTTAINEAKIDLTNKVESIKEERKQEKLNSDEKIEKNGFFVSRKLINKETNRSCSVCDKYSFSLKDDMYLSKYDCCFECYVEYIEDREQRWEKGWRPDNGRK